MAIEWAADQWDIDLLDKKTDHSSLLFMGESGCVIEPHFRPLCTLHTCAIYSMGCKLGDSKWTRCYMALREKIDGTEFKLYEEQNIEGKTSTDSEKIEV